MCGNAHAQVARLDLKGLDVHLGALSVDLVDCLVQLAPRLRYLRVNMTDAAVLEIKGGSGFTARW